MSRRLLVKVEGAVYSVPCEWAGLEVTVHVGAAEIEIAGRTGREVYPRLRFGQRCIRYRGRDSVRRRLRRAARRWAVSRGVVAEVVKTQARALKMPGLLREYEALARQAREERWTHEEYLHEVLAVEIQSRTDSAGRQRIRDARFPETKTLDTFDFHACEVIDAAQIADLARGRWVADAETRWTMTRNSSR